MIKYKLSEKKQTNKLKLVHYKNDFFPKGFAPYYDFGKSTQKLRGKQ